MLKSALVLLFTLFMAQPMAHAYCVLDALDDGNTGFINDSGNSNDDCSTKLELQNESRVEAYVGFRNGVRVSPNQGRQQAAFAHLDVCFTRGYVDVDSISGLSDCYQWCSDNSFNMACYNNGTQSSLGDCWTRCDTIEWGLPR